MSYPDKLGSNDTALQFAEKKASVTMAKLRASPPELFFLRKFGKQSKNSFNGNIRAIIDKGLVELITVLYPFSVRVSMSCSF